MDRFYLENVALYKNLVKAFNTPSSKGPTMTNNPAMTVCARIRPLSQEDQTAGYPYATFRRQNEANTVQMHDLYNHPRGRPILKSFSYEVDRLFDTSTTTEEIYDGLVVNLVSFAKQGGISTLFSYGQTGSGKTFTVSRLQQLVADSLMSEQASSQAKIYLTIVDLAGNSASDLLESRKSISLLEDSSGNVQLAGATEHEIQSKDEMLSLIECAATFRRTATTHKNDVSSRSHGICRVRLSDPAKDLEGFIYLVDLAGSEVARDSATHGVERMRETREINTSLSVLKDCIRGKAESDLAKKASTNTAQKSKQRIPKPHIPFRQSALTKVLKHVFDPMERRACKTIVIACLNPSLADVAATKNTLCYAEMLRVLVPKRHSSHDNISSNSKEVPFTKRIHPGMVISWHQPSSNSNSNSTSSNQQITPSLAVILCPAHVSGLDSADSANNHTAMDNNDAENRTRYLCAQFFKSPSINAAYELNLWDQEVIDISMMDGEVNLEYDGVDRCYRLRN